MIAVALGVVCTASGCAAGTRRLTLGAHDPDARAERTAQAPRVASLSSGMTRHFEYVFPDGAMYVYDIDHGHRLVQRVPMPGVIGARGVVASPRTHMLYISYGAFGGQGTTGRLLAYNLLAGSVVYDRSYSRGVDNMAIDPAGNRIYMPDGEASRDGVWTVIAARSGNVIGSINGGLSPHETIVGLSGGCRAKPRGSARGTGAGWGVGARRPGIGRCGPGGLFRPSGWLSGGGGAW